jgi:hypothetical protein
VTLTNGVDYQLPAGATPQNTFILMLATPSNYGNRVVSPAQHDGCDQESAYFTDHADPTVSVSMARIGTDNTIGNYRKDWAFITYLGPVGGAHEFVVKDQGSVLKAATIGGTPDVPYVPASKNLNFADRTKAIPMITSVAFTTSVNSTEMQATALGHLVDQGGGNYDPGFSFRGTDERGFSYQVVEFLGSKWNIQELYLTSEDDIWPIVNAWSSGSPNDVDVRTLASFGLSPVADVSKTWVYKQAMSEDGGTAQADSSTPIYSLTGVDQLTRRRASTSGSSSLNIALWFIENPDISVTHSEVYRTADADGPIVVSAPLPLGVTDPTSTIIHAQKSSDFFDGIAPVESPYISMYYTMSGVPDVEFGERRGNHNRWFHYQVIDVSALSTEATATGLDTVPSSFWETGEYHPLIRGINQDDSSYILFLPEGSDQVVYGFFSQPSKEWDPTVGNINLKFRIRVPTGGVGAYSIQLEVGYIDDLLAPITVGTGITQSGTLEVDGDDKWATLTHAEPRTNFPADVDDRTLFWRITANIATQTLEYFSPNTTEVEGGYTPINQLTIHAALDKSDGAGGWTEDDSVHVEAPDIVEGETKYLEVGIENFEIKEPLPLTPEIHVRYLVPDVAMLANVRLSEEDDGGNLTTIYEELNIVPPAANVPVDLLISVTSAAARSITDHNRLRLALGFTGISGGVGPVVYQAEEVSTINRFTKVGAGTDTGVVSDDDDDTGWVSNQAQGDPLFGNVNAILKFGFNVPTPPNLSGEVKVRFKIGNRGTSTSACDVLLTDPGGTIFSDFVSFSQNPEEWVEIILSEGQKANISDWGNLSLEFFRRESNSGAGEDTYIAEVQIVAETGNTSGGIFYSASPKWVVDGNVDVSWVRADAPAAEDFIPGDTLRAYVGTKLRLYELESPDFLWTDVSKAAADYNLTRSKSWHINHWGDKVIATNFADPVQVKNVGDTEFRDLIGFDNSGVAIPDYVTDGFLYPRSRFAAPINSFLCLANIDSAQAPDGRAHTFWCSAQGDPTRFHPGSFEFKSSLFQLTATPGEITMLVGGEYGMIFKENSVWRADYVGLPLIFNFSQISAFQGTVYPRSVVVADDDIYFWGASSIFVIREVSHGYVDKYLFDSVFEPMRLDANAQFDVRENDSKVIGAYDPYSECIYWYYKTSNDSHFMNTGCLVYNPKDNRFSVLSGELDSSGHVDPDLMPTLFDLRLRSVKATAAISLGNRLSQSTHLTRSLLLVTDSVDS